MQSEWSPRARTSRYDVALPPFSFLLILSIVHVWSTKMPLSHSKTAYLLPLKPGMSAIFATFFVHLSQIESSDN